MGNVNIHSVLMVRLFRSHVSSQVVLIDVSVFELGIMEHLEVWVPGRFSPKSYGIFTFFHNEPQRLADGLVKLIFSGIPGPLCFAGRSHINFRLINGRPPWTPIFC